MLCIASERVRDRCIMRFLIGIVVSDSMVLWSVLSLAALRLTEM